MYVKVAKLVDRKYVLIKLNLVLTCYTSEVVQERIRPNPDLARFVTASDVASLAKESTLLDLLEDTFRTTRAAFEAPLMSATARSSVKDLIRQFEVQSIRLALGKPASKAFVPGVSTGRLDVEKLSTVKDNWVKHISTTLKDVDVCMLTGYELLNPLDDSGHGIADQDSGAREM
jgi:hypothetical protein